MSWWRSWSGPAITAARKAEIAALERGVADPEAGDRADAGEVRDFVHADLAEPGGGLVHVYQDGSIALNHGGTEMGQGLFQKVAQVTASVFRAWTSGAGEDHRDGYREGAEHLGHGGSRRGRT
jgi:hypothetical protein